MSRERDSSPPDYLDALSPRPEGLPLFLANNSGPSANKKNMSSSAAQVVDSSSARRRGGVFDGVQPNVAAEHSLSTDEDADDEDDSSGKIKREQGFPSSGIGMESRMAPVPGEGAYGAGRKEFGLGGPKDGGRWDKYMPPERRTWLETFQEIGYDLKPQIPLIIYTCLALFTRLYRIGANNSVVWDEAHFGKFGAYYLNRTFFFDVHPPLGKMLVGLAGALSGFNGSFDFPSGAVYPDHVPYKAMRVLLALPGIAMVPLAWGTAVELRMTQWSRHVVTLMVLTDIAWLVISRFILLDSMLLFFTFTTVYCLAGFNNQQRRPFEEDWWLWLVATGLSIGCVMSVKWVGFFVTALVGIYTIEDLWNKLGDLKMPYRVYLRHFVARVLCLIVLPFCFYAFTFKLHFIILNQSGTGDSQMSSLFQAHLEGNDFSKNPLEPAYGSRLTFKNMGYGGGLLHSHVQTYPVGSQQQQVTCYHYKDENNEWVVTPTWEDPAVSPDEPLRFLKDGDTVRLVHHSTGRNLHSHSVVAPVSKLNNEISCYGNATVGDSNDYWVIEVVDDTIRGSAKKWERIHSLSTRIRLKHLNSNCYVRAANAVLPQWGFKQVEVSCDKENNPKDEHTFWNIESHWNDRLPAGDQKLYKSPFFRDFWHLNVAMMTSNNALVPDSDKEDTIASKPFEWPFLWNGMRMNGWNDNGIKYYLLGNAVTWWMASSSLFVFVGALLWHLARFQRKINDFGPGEWNQFLYVSKIAFGGWALHYIPFLIMGRVTYLHHYLPTLWFSVLMVGNLLDHFVFRSRRFTQKAKIGVFSLVVGSVLVTFYVFRECAFGIEGPANDLKWHRWRKTWNLHD